MSVKCIGYTGTCDEGAMNNDEWYSDSREITRNDDKSNKKEVNDYTRTLKPRVIHAHNSHTFPYNILGKSVRI